MTTPYSVVLIAVAVGIVPVFGWFLFIAKRDGLTIINFNFLIKVFFWGVLAAIPASIVEIVLIETDIDVQILEIIKSVSLHQRILVAIAIFLPVATVAFIEELAKASGIIASLSRKQIKTSNDGMIYGMVVGLAFAVTENGVYFASSIQTELGSGFLELVLLRFILSTSAHIIYSGMMGMFFGEMKLINSVTGKILFAILGFGIPIFVHTAFNFLLGTQYNKMVIVIIIGGFLLLWLKYLLNKKRIVANVT